MSVGVLLITHGDIGAVLLRSALDILKRSPLPVATLAAPSGCEPEQILREARSAAEQLDSGDGVLVLTDMYGATPSNIACRLADFQCVQVVSGVNLPMLIRVLNYPDLDLEALAKKAASGGRDGVLSCSPAQSSHAE